MKHKRKSGLCLLLLVLFALLCGCGDQAADIDAAFLANTSENFTHVSLRAGSTEALYCGNLNGTMHYGDPATLSAAPFIQDGVFYFPLEDVVPLMGGTCQIKGDAAEVYLYEQELIFRVGSQEITIDGVTHRSYCEDERAPQMIDGIFYLPQGFTASNQGTGLDGPELWLYPDMGIMILSKSTAVKCELGAAGAWLEEPFAQVPASVRASLRSKGTEPVAPRGGYDAERYDGDVISIWVARSNDPEDETPALDGCVVAVHLTGDTYCTWRGLRVGDSRERAELLYGDLGPDSSLFQAFPFEVEFDETDHVSAIQFNSYFFTPQ